MRRAGPSYTADTLSEIHASHPEAELTFIVGADTALTLPGWRDPGRVLDLARLAVARRPGATGPRCSMRCRAIDGAEPRVVFLEMPPIEASSSLARERLAAGEPTGGLLAADGARVHRAQRPLRPAGGGAALMDSEQLVAEASRLAADKKAHDVVELDLRGVVGYTDWFLVCTGNTGRQAKAIQDGILEGLKQRARSLAATGRGHARAAAGS